MAGDLGAWEGDDLSLTVSAFNGDGTDSDLPSPVRFIRNVSRLVLKRLRGHAAAMRRDAIGVFLLSPMPPQASPHPRQPMLDAGHIEVAGRVWFVNEVVSSGRYFEPPKLDDGSVFDFVIETLACGDVPAVVYNPMAAVPEVRFYPGGLAREELFDSMTIAEREVTIDDIIAVMHRVYEHDFITPDAQVKGGSAVWEDNDNFWVKRDAEAIVQSHIKTALAARFFDCNIRHEQTTRAGRIDLEVEQPSLGDGLQFTRPAAIEIKVLRSRGSTGRSWTTSGVRRWVRGGVRQAAAYRDERAAGGAILCCFDMRSADEGDAGCFVEVVGHAATLGVTLFRRFLFNSSDAWRTATQG